MDDGLDRLLTGAENHGMAEDQGHEVGDLQDVLRSCWARLTPGQRREVLAAHRDLLDWAAVEDVPSDREPDEDAAFVERYEPDYEGEDLFV